MRNVSIIEKGMPVNNREFQTEERANLTKCVASTRTKLESGTGNAEPINTTAKWAISEP